MTNEQKECVQSYVTMIDDFVIGKIPVATFEAEYLKKFKSEQTNFPEVIFDVLDELFANVDAYCPDPTEVKIEEKQLLELAKIALERLRNEI